MMKKRILLSLLCVLAVCAGVATQSVFAGLSRVQLVENSMFAGGSGNFYIAGSGVQVSGSAIEFTGESDAAARVVARKGVSDLKALGVEENFSAEIILTVTSLPADTRFGLVFGLPFAGAAAAAKNSAFVYFTLQSGELSLGICKYGADGEEQAILEPKPVGVSGQMQLNVAVDADGGITIGLNGAPFFEGADAACPTSGYLGFAQMGSGTAARVTGFVVTAYENLTPENVTLLETFDDNTFNANVWYSYSENTYDEVCYVRPENGALSFRNVASSFFSSMYSYSNLELSFDITDIQREPVYDGNTLVTPASSKIGVALGGSSPKSAATSEGLVVEFVPAGGSSVKAAASTQLVIKRSGTIVETVTLPKERNIFGTENDKTVNVRVTMLDARLTVQLKYADETAYETVLSFENDSVTPSGVVQIMGYGTLKSQIANMEPEQVQKGNFTVDNVSVANLDTDGKHITVGYKSNFYVIPADYVYEDSWDDSDMLFFK